MPPFVNYVTFNRLGLTERSLRSILNTPEDFEMHIIDSNSKDDTWSYIQSLSDSRIKSKTRFPLNNGPILPSNFNLTKRRPEQYFITIDSDVYMKTPNWISKFMEVFNAFPEAGLLGVHKGPPYCEKGPEVIARYSNGISYLELKHGKLGAPLDFVPGCCQCLRPELIREMGYWSEENGYGDAELSLRVNNHTSFRAGFVTGIQIDMTQKIHCSECRAKQWCKLDRSSNTCFTIHQKGHKNIEAAQLFMPKYYATFKELEEGKRTAYCASIFDPKSYETHFYNMEWAMENFNYFIQNTN